MTQTDSEYWTDKLKSLERGELEAVAAASTALTGLFSALLGVFGLVAFAGGLTTIDKLPSPAAGWVKLATIAAAALLALATVVAAAAAQNLHPRRLPGMSWQQLEARTRTRASRGLALLPVAKLAGLAAVAIVLVGSAAVVFIGEDSSSSPPNIVAIVDGTGVCGRLSTSDGALRAGDTVLTGVTDLTVVGTCP